MKVCYVTDRKALAGSAEEQIRSLLEKMESAARAGVDWIQIREKDLSGRELAALAGEAVRRIPRSCRVLVNDRLDVAMAGGAGGVHLGERSMPVEEARRFVREKNPGGDFLVGVSGHSIESVQTAERLGADYAIFGPVYETPSKIAFGPPQGVGQLAEVCRSVSGPVIAIGGITIRNAGECVRSGASGIAAIRMFQDATDLAALVRTLRKG
jgi:thiamine-phosphate pyrophosphorylase